MNDPQKADRQAAALKTRRLVLHRAWLHYAEESEISNLDAPRKNDACCNRPPS